MEDDEIEETDAIDRLSPRLAASFAIGERNRLFFSFGRYVQRPLFSELYADYRFLEYKVRTGGYYYAFGNSALKPTSALMYEVGWKSDLSAKIGVCAVGFYKDISE